MKNYADNKKDYVRKKCNTPDTNAGGIDIFKKNYKNKKS